MLTSVLSNAGKVIILIVCARIWYHGGTMEGTGWEAAWNYITWTVTAGFALYIILDTWLEDREARRLSRVLRSKNRRIARLEQEIEAYQRGDVIALERERDVRRNDSEEGYGAG